MAKSSSLFPGKKKSGRTFKKIGGQRFKSREHTGFNIPNHFQPKGTKGKKSTRRTKKG
jgi:hypothetical protein